jgi:hypothetical protein
MTMKLVFLFLLVISFWVGSMIYSANIPTQAQEERPCVKRSDGTTTIVTVRKLFAPLSGDNRYLDDCIGNEDTIFWLVTEKGYHIVTSNEYEVYLER